MPVRKTVFVIGAGASKEAGLPVAEKLKESIATALNIGLILPDRVDSGDARIVDALRLVMKAEHPPARRVLAQRQAFLAALEPVLQTPQLAAGRGDL